MTRRTGHFSSCNFLCLLSHRSYCSCLSFLLCRSACSWLFVSSMSFCLFLVFHFFYVGLLVLGLSFLLCHSACSWSFVSSVSLCLFLVSYLTSSSCCSCCCCFSGSYSCSVFSCIIESFLLRFGLSPSATNARLPVRFAKNILCR